MYFGLYIYIEFVRDAVNQRPSSGREGSLESSTTSDLYQFKCKEYFNIIKEVRATRNPFY